MSLVARGRQGSRPGPHADDYDGRQEHILYMHSDHCPPVYEQGNAIQDQSQHQGQVHQMWMCIFYVAY